jgi:N-methylhydantoinase B
MSVTKGALITHEQAGGGGYGDPLERDSALVREDVADGKITRAFAAEHHGVDATEVHLAKAAVRSSANVG